MDKKPIGPGPSHQLPSTVGFDQHDPTRCRAPAFSLGTRTVLPTEKKGLSPAPNTYNPIRFTRYGLSSSQSNSLGPKLPKKFATCSPSPNTYNPKYDNIAPAFSILSRTPPIRINKNIPAPNAYNLPTCIGSSIPDKCNSGAFSVLSRHCPPFGKTPSPGPKYMLPNINIYKKSSPSSSLGDRLPKKGAFLRPGPNKYNPEYNLYTNSPSYSFGVKRCPFLKTLYLPQDLED